MYKIFRFIFNFYILINIHVAISVASLYLIFNPDYNIDYLIYLVSGTIVSYTFIRILSFGANRFFIKKFFAKHRYIIGIFVGICAIIALFAFIRLPLRMQLALIPFSILTIFYNYSHIHLPFDRLRNNGFAKIFVVSLVWTGLIIIVPATVNIITLPSLLIYKSLFVFLMVLMLTLSFDQRDLLIDDTDLKTIPRFAGKYLWVFYALFVILISLLNFLIFKSEIFVLNEIILLVSAFLSFRSNEYKSFYYTAFWIEAIPIFWLGLVYLINN